MKSLDAVLQEVESMEPDMVQTAKEMLSIPALAPCNGGKGEVLKADYLMMKVPGFDSIQRFDVPDSTDPSVMRSSIIVRKNGKKDGTLWFVSHIDVVPTGDPELWDTPPFEPTLKDGRIYCRGSEDDGQSVISTLYASLPFQDQEFEGMSLGLAFVADEETSSEHGIQYLLENGVFGPWDVMIVPDHVSPKGQDISVAEKHIIWLRFRIEGKSVHASAPGTGINAYKVSTKLLVELMETLENRFMQSDEMYCPSASTFEPTKRIATVENVNTIPGYDEFCMDIRLNPAYDPDLAISIADEIADKHAERTGAKITVEVLQKAIAGKPSSTDSPGFKALSDAVESVTGARPRPVGIAGGTCANFFRVKGFDAYAWQTGDGVMHSPNEYMIVENMVNDAKVFATMIHRLCLQ